MSGVHRMRRFTNAIWTRISPLRTRSTQRVEPIAEALFRRCCGNLAVLSSEASFAWPLGGRALQAKMVIQRLLALSAAALAASTIVCSAGPCLPEIERMQERINAKVAAATNTGPSLPEGSNALLHHQPTPRSMAAAEGISPEIVKAVREAMTRARDADQAGDKVACEQAARGGSTLHRSVTAKARRRKTVN